MDLKLGIVISSNFIHVGLVNSQFISLFELKFKYKDFESSNLGEYITGKLNETGIESSDLKSISLFTEEISKNSKELVKQVELFSKENNIELNNINNADWLIESNWIYTKEQIEEEEIKNSNVQYPYLTAISTRDSLDIIINMEKGDAKIVGSSIDISPEELINYVTNYLGVKDEKHYEELSLLGDPEVLDYKPAIKPDFDISLVDLKKIFEDYYASEAAKIAKHEPVLKEELNTNLNADMVSTINDKLFDYLITKILGIADAFEINNISLVGKLWNNKRLQDMLIRQSIDDFIVKFPDRNTPIPLGSFLAAYDL